ncbi:MAG TPA: Rieske (2Fe-2S) protein [Trebonia sp.]|nr:Rieske (2Fe-2S) protein [Trebonia sp.]
MTQEPQQDTRATRATRRGVLAGVGLVGLAGAVSACGSGGSSSSSAGTNAGAPPATGAASAPSSASGASGGSTAGAQGSALAATSEIPVGSGKIFTSEKIVVTQPNSGDFKAFSAVCTHMGCIVSTISNGTIDCPCHGSQYSISTGAVVGGPAPSPLAAQAIKVTGSNIFQG